jgi:hypothetical protein
MSPSLTSLHPPLSQTWPARGGGGVPASASHAEAIAAVVRAIRDRRPFVAITGEENLAKSLVLEAVIASLGTRFVRFVRVANPRGGTLTLRRIVGQVGKLGQEIPDPNEGARVLRALRERQGDETQVVLVVEQAESLGQHALSFLQLLPRTTAPNAPLLQVLFVGRPGFWALLEDVRFGRLRDQLTVRVVVEPLIVRRPRHSIAYWLGLIDWRARWRAVADKAAPLLAQHGLRLRSQIELAFHQASNFSRKLGKRMRRRLTTKPGRIGHAPDPGPVPAGRVSAPGAARARLAAQGERDFRAKRSHLGVGLVLGFGGALAMVTAIGTAFYRGLPSSLSPFKAPAEVARPAAREAVSPSPAAAPALPSKNASVPETTPPVSAREPSAGPAPAPPAANPAASVSGPRDRLRSDFDDFLNHLGGKLGLLTDRQREELFQQYVASRTATNVGSPSRSPRRVVIHFRSASPADETEAGRLAAALGTDAGSAQTRAVADVPRTAMIRYFFDEDKEAAQNVARTLGRASGMTWAVRDFTSYRPGPSPGTIEAWLPPR